jgi:hypothetical protein
MVRTGRCYCGVVQYEVRGQLGPPVNCHCQNCRRAHGAAFATVSLVQSADFVITAGQDAIGEYQNPSGSRFFCHQCGGRLFNRTKSTEKFLLLVLATLDQDPNQKPVMHVNVGSKAPWYEILDRLPQHDALPPDVESALSS